jgi:hypothetical protein
MGRAPTGQGLASALQAFARPRACCAMGLTPCLTKPSPWRRWVISVSVATTCHVAGSDRFQGDICKANTSLENMRKDLEEEALRLIRRHHMLWYVVGGVWWWGVLRGGCCCCEREDVDLP